MISLTETLGPFQTVEIDEPSPEKLWAVYVPTIRNDGRPIRLRFHRLWDAKVRSISGGLSVLEPIKGQWHYKGEVVHERMIPVLIRCSAAQINEIVRFTADYYEQDAVFYYKVSDECLIYHRSNP